MGHSMMEPKDNTSFPTDAFTSAIRDAISKEIKRAMRHDGTIAHMNAMAQYLEGTAKGITKGREQIVAKSVEKVCDELISSGELVHIPDHLLPDDQRDGEPRYASPERLREMENDSVQGQPIQSSR